MPSVSENDPFLTISQGQLGDASPVTLTGAIDADDVGLTISIYEGATLLGTTTAAADDLWTYQAALSGPGPYAFSAQASGLDDETLTSDTAYLAIGGQTIDFADSSGDSASLYNAIGDWGLINGSNGRIYLIDAQASVVGGDDAISLTGEVHDTVSLYDTSGQPDSVTGYDDVVVLVDAQASISGGYNKVLFDGAGGSASLSATSGQWDWVYGDDGAVTLDAAQASVIGGDDTISLVGASPDAVSLYNSSNHSDSVTGDDSNINLTDAWASVTGGYNKIFLHASDDWVNLYATNGHWDWVYGNDDDDSVTLNSAQASVIGNVQINLLGASRDYVSLYDTSGVPPYINALNAQNGYTGSETILLTNAQAIVSGQSNSIYFLGASDDAVTVEEEIGGGADVVYGDDGVVNMLGAAASVIGRDDTITFGAFYGSSSNSVGLSAGASDLLQFSPGIGGAETVYGFDASDVLQFSASDFANFTALSGRMSQSGGDTVIPLGDDAVTLSGILPSSLTASEFKFV